MNAPEQTTNEFADWALVELFGHQKIAGFCSVQNIGQAMIRVDVPDATGNTLFSRFYSPSAIYSISPVSKQIAIGIAVKLDMPPVTRFDLAQLSRQSAPQLPMSEEDKEGRYGE
jgi:hypothetical protein